MGDLDSILGDLAASTRRGSEAGVVNDPIVFDFSVNDIFRWIGYITCGTICASIIFYPAVMFVAMTGLDGIFYRRRERRYQKKVGHE